jgi:hypothetical protein
MSGIAPNSNQLKPGETPPDPARTAGSRLAARYEVMAINGLICKVIFDQNPTNSFYVEESLAIDWMYPYETPFGIIMKINRDPLPELTPMTCSSWTTSFGRNFPSGSAAIGSPTTPP